MKKYFITVLTVFICVNALAQTVSDPTLAALIEGEKYADALKASQAKLALKPDDLDAHTALALAASGGDLASAAREGALKQLEACVERTPQAAACHWGVGSVAGVLAMSGGMVRALRMAPKIKASFVKALELDPLYAPARSGLVQYYLIAPGIAGGSEKKALEAAEAEQARQPEPAKLFKAMVNIHNNALDKAQANLSAINPDSYANDKGMRDDVEQQWNSLGFALLKDKQATKAKPIFEKLIKVRSSHAFPAYGLGRAQIDLGQLDEGIAQLQRAATLKDAEQLPIDYRLGIAYQTKGDKAAAKAALTKALQSKNMSSENKKDAEKRLSELG
jgi:Tetratricopeptide repeat